METIDIEPHCMVVTELPQQRRQRILCQYRGKLPSKREAVEVRPLYATQSPMFNRDLQAPVKVGYVQGDAPQWCLSVYLPLDGLKDCVNGSLTLRNGTFQQSFRFRMSMMKEHFISFWV